MNRLIRRASKQLTVSNAAVLLIATSMIGQILGFMRVKLINANFPAVGDGSTDAFFAAFKIPDLFFLTLAAGALGVAFIPFLSDKLEEGKKKAAWELSSSLLNLLSLVMGVVSLLMIIFAEPLIHYIVAPNLSPDQLNNAVTIMRLISINPLLFTITGVLMSMQQTVGRFFFYAIAPLFYNLSIIISTIVFSLAPNNNGGPWHLGIVGLGIGAAVGAVLQLLIALIGMKGMNFKYHPIINWKDKSFRGVLRQLPPRSVDQGIDAINSIVETNFARRLGEGFISYYENAFVLHNAPILLIGTAISTAAFPKLTERLSQGRPDLFRRDFIRVLRVMIWIALPVVVVGYFTRGYLARLIFTRDAPEIALIFGFLSGAILFRVIYSIFSRYFYAHKDTWTPLIVSLFTIALNIFLAFTLARPSSYGVAGLALAQAIAAMIEVAILATIITVKDRQLFDKPFLDALSRMLSATGFSIVATYIMISLLPLTLGDKGFVTLGTKLGVITGVTFTVYLAVSWMLRLDETVPVMKKIKQIVLKPIRMQW